MDLSFQEKSLWVMFLGMLVVFGYYFSMALPTDAVDVLPQHKVLFGVAVAYLVASQVAGHILIAIVDPRDETDERDRLIELKGTRVGSWVLAVGVFVTLVVAVQTQGNFLFTHVLLGSWVLAQLAETGSQLYLYRRGA